MWLQAALHAVEAALPTDAGSVAYGYRLHHSRLQARSLAAGAAELVLHVDESNGPARRLYEELGFAPGRLAAPLVDHFLGERFVGGTSAPQLLLSKGLPLDDEAR